MENEIEKINPVDMSPAAMFKEAISSGADLEKLEKFMGLQERWEANEAKKVFNSSMVNVHKNIPLVGKSLNNPQTHSKYASLDMIICTVKEIYTAEGFSIIFYEGKTEIENHIRVCADVIHSLGHKETYHYDVPLDGKGIKGNVNMTPIHAKASSISYGRRYLMCMIWNVPTGDDNDGNTSEPVECITAEQIKTLQDGLKEIGKKEERFLIYLKVTEFKELPKDDFKKAMTAIEASKAKVKK